MSNPSTVKYFEPKSLITEKEIELKIKQMADQINADYGQNEITAICTLKGSLIFFSDLLKHLKMPVHCEFFGVSSYGNQMSTSGEVKVTLDLSEPIADKHVIIFEDIVDTGITLAYLVETLERRKPASLRTATFLHKPEAAQVQNLPLNYIGFQIQNQFVVGYGLDYAQKFRGLPYIGVIENEH